MIPGKGKVINDLRRAASTADAVYLAGDPDREGEAISAHLAMVLSKPAKFLINEEELNGDGWKNGKNGKNGAKAGAKEGEGRSQKKGRRTNSRPVRLALKGKAS